MTYKHVFLRTWFWIIEFAVGISDPYGKNSATYSLY